MSESMEARIVSFCDTALDELYRRFNPPSRLTIEELDRIVNLVDRLSYLRADQSEKSYGILGGD